MQTNVGISRHVACIRTDIRASKKIRLHAGYLLTLGARLPVSRFVTISRFHFCTAPCLLSIKFSEVLSLASSISLVSLFFTIWWIALSTFRTTEPWWFPPQLSHHRNFAVASPETEPYFLLPFFQWAPHKIWGVAFKCNGECQAKQKEIWAKVWKNSLIQSICSLKIIYKFYHYHYISYHKQASLYCTVRKALDIDVCWNKGHIIIPCQKTGAWTALWNQCNKGTSSFASQRASICDGSIPCAYTNLNPTYATCAKISLVSCCVYGRMLTPS